MDKPKGTKDTEGRFKGRFTLTVGDLNAKLDELVAAGGGRGIAVRQQGGDNAAAAGKRAAVLRSLMQATTPTQMRWIVQIIIGNLKASHRDRPAARRTTTRLSMRRACQPCLDGLQVNIV